MFEGEYTTRAVQVPTINGTAPGVKADPRRVALIVSMSGVGTSVQLVATGAPDNLHKINVTTSTITEFKVRDYGPLVAYQWDVSAGGTGLTVNMIEVLKLQEGG